MNSGQPMRERRETLCAPDEEPITVSVYHRCTAVTVPAALALPHLPTYATAQDRQVGQRSDPLRGWRWFRIGSQFHCRGLAQGPVPQQQPQGRLEPQGQVGTASGVGVGAPASGRGLGSRGMEGLVSALARLGVPELAPHSSCEVANLATCNRVFCVQRGCIKSVTVNARIPAAQQKLTACDAAPPSICCLCWNDCLASRPGCYRLWRGAGRPSRHVLVPRSTSHAAVATPVLFRLDCQGPPGRPFVLS